MSKPRVWYAADALFTSDPKIQELGVAFGPGGPLAIVALHGLAKLHDPEGIVEARYASLARAAYLKNAHEAERIIAEAVELEILEELHPPEGGAFLIGFPHWNEWQRSQTGNAARCKRYRERTREQPEQTPDEDERRNIGALFIAWQTVCGHPTAKLTDGRRRAIRSRLREGYSPEQIARAFHGCAASDFHSGRDPQTQGKRYDDITLICRSGEKLEQFAAIPLKTDAVDDEERRREEDDGLEEQYA